MTQVLWYVLDQSKNPPEPSGPFDRAAIEGMIQRSALTAASSVARAGSETWSPAGDDPELRPLFGGGIDGRTTPPTLHQGTSVGPEIELPAAGLSVGTAFSLGWEVFKKGYVHLLLCVLILAACSAPLSGPGLFGGMMIGEAQRSGDSGLRILGSSLQWFGTGLNLLVWPLFAPVLIWPAVTVIRGEAGIGDVIVGFRRYLPLLGTSLLWTLFILAGALGFSIILFIISFLAGLFAGLFGRNNEAILVGIIVVMAIPMLIVFVIGVAYMIRATAASMFSYGLLVDPRASIRPGLDAVREGWRMASTQRAKPALIMFLAALIAAFTILLACAGYFFLGLPLYIAVMGATYELIRRDQTDVDGVGADGRTT